MSNWEVVSAKLGNVTDATREVAMLVFNAAKAAGVDVWFLWGIGQYPEHNSRLALDFMVRSEAAGDWVRDFIWVNRARLGVRHVIWEQHITSTVVNPGARTFMQDRGNPTANHYDHVHLLRFDAPVVTLPASAPVGGTTRRAWPSYMQTNHFFGLITGPEASHGGHYASEVEDVRAIQRRLITLGHVPGIHDIYSSWADGKFEQETVDAVARWQRAHFSAFTEYYGQVWKDDWHRLFTY